MNMEQEPTKTTQTETATTAEAAPQRPISKQQKLEEWAASQGLTDGGSSDPAPAAEAQAEPVDVAASPTKDEQAEGEKPDAEAKPEEEAPRLSKQHLRLLEKEKKFLEREKSFRAQEAEVNKRQERLDDFDARMTRLKQNIYDNPDAALKEVGLSVDWLIQAATNPNRQGTQQPQQSSAEIQALRAEIEELKGHRHQETTETHMQTVASAIVEELGSGRYKNLAADPKQHVAEVWSEMELLAARSERLGQEIDFEQLYAQACRRVDKLHSADEALPTKPAQPSKKPTGSTTLGKDPVAPVLPARGAGKKLSKTEILDRWADSIGLK